MLIVREYDLNKRLWLGLLPYDPNPKDSRTV